MEKKNSFLNKLTDKRKIRSSNYVDYCKLIGLLERTKMTTVIFTTIFITGMNQVRSIIDKFIPLQSGSVFYKRPQADRGAM